MADAEDVGLSVENDVNSQPTSATQCCYLCNQCPAAFSSLPDLESHLQSHLTEEIPSKTKTSLEPIENDISEAASPSIYSEENEAEKLGLDEVDKLMMEEEDNEVILPDETSPGERLFTCRFCGKMFQTRSQLNIHYTHTHRDKPQYECEHCGKIFSVKRELATHRRIHSGEQTHRCTQCGKEFGTRQLLKKHWMWHTGQRSHVCPHCGKAFFQKGHLTQHLMIHAGGRPHVCNLCNKTFIFKFDLNRHMKIHAERGFNCTKCAKSFIKQSALVDHESKCVGPTGKEITLDGANNNNEDSFASEGAPTMTQINRVSSQLSESAGDSGITAGKQRVLCIFCMQDFASQAAYAVHFSLVHCRQAANMLSQQQALALQSVSAANVGAMFPHMTSRLDDPANQMDITNPINQSTSTSDPIDQPCSVNVSSGFDFLHQPQIKLESPSVDQTRVGSDDDSESSPAKSAGSENGLSEEGRVSTDNTHVCAECNCANPKLGQAMQRLAHLQRTLHVKESELDHLKDKIQRVGFVAGSLLDSCSEFDKLWMLHSKKVYSQIQAVLHGLE